MADGTAGLSVSVVGSEVVLAQVRGEVARLLREVAGKETDLRVASRLIEVAAAVSQNLSHAEAVARMQSAPVHTGLTHNPGLAKPKALDAVGTTGGKVTTEVTKG